MESIDPLGDGLCVLLLADPGQEHAWMSFASWYSFRRWVPDATIVVAAARPTRGQDQGVFPWTHRARVRSFCHRGDPASVALGRGYAREPLLVLPSGTMALEPLSDAILAVARLGGVQDGSGLVAAATSYEPCPLVHPRDGCGGFVMERWIDRAGHPFRGARGYQRGDLTVNERRVLSLWSQLCPIYDLIG